VVEAFEHLVLVDPPPSPSAADRVARPRTEPSERSSASRTPHPGYLHQLWTESERRFSLEMAAPQAPSRETVVRVFRSLREAGQCGGARLREALCGVGPHPLDPVTAARCFRVLTELRLLRGVPREGDGTVGVVSSEGTKLERSAAFRAYHDDLPEARRYLERRTLS
jgi:hypothetical protein